MTTTYLGSGDASRHRRDYRPEWLDNLADDVTIEASVLTGIAVGPPQRLLAADGSARDNQPAWRWRRCPGSDSLLRRCVGCRELFTVKDCGPSNPTHGGPPNGRQCLPRDRSDRR
jgi:hypothetical protein